MSNRIQEAKQIVAPSHVLRSGEQTISVEGGNITATVRNASSPPVLAIHNLSGYSRSWDWLANEAPALTLVMPDLRGRRGSFNTPYLRDKGTLEMHADDMIAILDSLGIDSIHVLGWSFGAVIALHMAVKCPDRVRSITLVDGGPPMSPPPGRSRDNIRDLFRPQFASNERHWRVTDYMDYFVRSLAPLMDRDDPILTDYMTHILQEGRVLRSLDAMLTDVTAMFFDPTGWEDVTDVPRRFIKPEWSLGRDSPPMYPAAALDDIRKRCVDVRLVDGLDHLTVVMSRTGAAITADVLADALSVNIRQAPEDITNEDEAVASTVQESLNETHGLWKLIDPQIGMYLYYPTAN
ncbi:alpha/beta-hydrolase [Xylariomycetidae sp. FL2044]|nr:alpha/beta-hydrolase [Xylariomycetidae sp. FL2044]